MRTLLWLLSMLVLAVALGLLASLNPGYVLLVWPPHQVAYLSLNAIIILTVLSLFLLYGAMRGLHALLQLPQEVRAYRARKQAQLAEADAAEILILHLAGRHQKVSKQVERAMAHQKNPNMRHVLALIGARSAQEMRHTALCERLLNLDLPAKDELAQVARGLTQAELALDQRDFAGALEALNVVRGWSPKLTSALLLELRTRQRLGQMQDALPLLEHLSKSEAMDPTQLRLYRQQTWQAQLQHRDWTARALVEWWQRVPAEDRAYLPLLNAAVRRLVGLGEADLALQSLNQALELDWQAEGARLLVLPCWPAAHRMRRLQMAEAWLLAHPEEPLLLLTLAELCRDESLWGKAESYAEASLALQASPHAHALLAELLRRRDDNEQAQRHEREGLLLACQVSPR